MTVLITGASDGLGMALARQFRKLNTPVIALGRRPYTSLVSAPYGAGQYLEVDLCQPTAERLVTRVLSSQNVSSLDFVIHNAATGYFGPVGDQDPENLAQLVELNFTAPIALTRALATRLKNARGKLVLIGSVAASLPAPEYAVYAATKRGLEGFARSLRHEVGRDFRVQVIHPGPIRTGFHERIGVNPTDFGADRFPAAEDVAARIVQAIRSHRQVVTLGATFRMASLASRTFPRTFDRIYGRRFR